MIQACEKGMYLSEVASLSLFLLALLGLGVLLIMYLDGHFTPDHVNYWKKRTSLYKENQYLKQELEKLQNNGSTSCEWSPILIDQDSRK